MTVLILAFLFSMAMGDSVGIRMAKSLGEGRAQGAAFVARLGIIVSVIGGVVIAGRARGKTHGGTVFPNGNNHLGRGEQCPSIQNPWSFMDFFGKTRDDAAA